MSTTTLLIKVAPFLIGISTPYPVFAGFCRFSCYSSPKYGKTSQKVQRKATVFCLLLKKVSKTHIFKVKFLFEWVFQEAKMIFHSEKSQKFKKSMYLIIICIPNFQMSVFKARQPSVVWNNSIKPSITPDFSPFGS